MRMKGGVMPRQAEFEALYVAGRRFRDAVLDSDDSLFTPGRPVWNAATLQALVDRYEADTSRDKLEIKLSRQVADADGVTRQLAAELLYLHLLLPCDTKGAKKRAMVTTILEPLRPAVTIPHKLGQALDQGIATIGAALAWQSAQFAYLLRLMRFWKSLPSQERSALLADPWAFKSFLFENGVPSRGAQVQREAVLYLVFPDTFEDSVSIDHKQMISAAFGDRIVEQTNDVDRQLMQIRQSLIDEYGTRFSFYDPPLRSLWNPPPPAPHSDARRVIETLFPDEQVRRAALGVLGQSIRTAHDANPWAWAVTMPAGKQVRLNVGPIETVVLESGGIVLIVDEDKLDNSSHEIIAPGFRHKVVPGAVGTTPLRLADVEARYATLRPAHTQVLKAAANQQQSVASRWAKYHQRSVLDYMKGFLGVQLPDPQYDASLVAPPPSNSFDKLLKDLEGNLHFPVEIVSNYLLALQAKRFVILTGISGTGKTQLAIAVAKHFQSRVRRSKVVDIPDDGISLEVFDYMLRHHHMVLPVAFVADLLLGFDQETYSRSVTVHYPEGTTTLTLRKEPGRNVTRLFLSKGGFRAWFDTQFKVGDHVVLQAIKGDEGAIQALQFSLPVIRESEERVDNYAVTAVRPDWTDNRGLLGYYNPLTGRYAITPFLRLLLRATEEYEQAQRENRPAQPFFALLDEMNLARVEHYFSDFLSCLESGEKLDLHDDLTIERGETDEAVAVPRQLAIPENLFFTGTVNVDETTYMFSPKVLDRAFTIEFNEVDLEAFGFISNSERADNTTPLYLRQFAGIPNDNRKPNSQDWAAFGGLLDGSLRRVVIDLNAALATEGHHFGYRVANEIARFVLLAHRQGGDAPDTLWAALDLAILEKVLPKFHGTQQELGSVLASVFAFALDVDGVASPFTDALQYASSIRQGRLVPANAESVDPQLPRTAAKVWTMLKRLRQQGFTSFIG